MNVSVIIPCLNEERTVAMCVKKAQEGITALGTEGEILVIDNGSTDRTREVATLAGAKVISVQERGYGSAIIGGINAATGTYTVIADGDDSYDFRELTGFIRKLESEGHDLVIGNRFKGEIRQGAMPFLNRYLGNPVLSGIGRVLFGDVCGDFHCGLRAGKTESLRAEKRGCDHMNIATEMIIKAARMKMSIAELPITYSKDGRNRPPHMRRWRDGFSCLIFMFHYKLFPSHF